MKRADMRQACIDADVAVGSTWRDTDTKEIVRVLGLAYYKYSVLVLIQRLSAEELIEAVESEQFHREYIPHVQKTT